MYLSKKHFLLSKQVLNRLFSGKKSSSITTVAGIEATACLQIDSEITAGILLKSTGTWSSGLPTTIGMESDVSFEWWAAILSAVDKHDFLESSDDSFRGSNVVWLISSSRLVDSIPAAVYLCVIVVYVMIGEANSTRMWSCLKLMLDLSLLFFLVLDITESEDLKASYYDKLCQKKMKIWVEEQWCWAEMMCQEEELCRCSTGFLNLNKSLEQMQVDMMIRRADLWITFETFTGSGVISEKYATNMNL